ncbi:helix-turn-helix domain-containing protein [Cyanobacteria bacterium FACHB-472]|nr:helix-turn-helix domain-containing protein [Cyanobacteria bacterium FACHB-472]
MLIQRAPLPIPETEPPLYEDTPLIAAGSVMVGSMKAQLKKKEWTEDSNGIALFVYREKGNPNIIKHYISNPGQISLLPWDEAEQIIDKFGFTTAKLHLLFAAYAVQQEKPWESKFSLKASNLVKTLGWDRNHNKNQCEKLLDIANTAYALDQLVVESAWVDGINKKGQPFGSNSVGRIWNVSISPYGQMNIEGKVEQPTEVYITVQPGLWTEEFLNRAGAISKEALYQFGYISQEILKIDPYHDELALRLAIHLTLESSSHTSGNYQVRDLLEAVLPKPQINAARTNCKKAYNLKQQWDSALKLLMSLGWQVDFDTTYPEWLQPGNKERNPRGYLDKLLTARITILPPDPIPKLLTAKTESKPLLLKSATSFDLTGTQIRDARENKGWSQAKLAGWLGVSRSLVALIERGQRPISDKLKPKLRKLLEI